MLDRPMIRRLTVKRMVMTRRPARSLLILNLVLSTPVSTPAANPAATETATPRPGGMPAAIMAAVIAPPRGKLPSMVRSGKRMIRKEIITPKVTRAYSNPCRRETIRILIMTSHTGCGILDELVKSSHLVIPVKTGIQNPLKRWIPASVRNDKLEKS